MFVLQREELDCARRMRGGEASSSRSGGSPGSLARALEAAEERLRETLVDGLAWVSFKVIRLNYYVFICLIDF